MKHLTTKYVLGFLFAIVVASLFVTTFTACEDNDEKPPAVVDPVKPVDPTPTPVVVDPTPKPELPEYCKYDETKKFVCGAKPATKSLGAKNAVWLGLPPCGPDTDGDTVGEGAAFFKTLEEIEAISKKTGTSIRVQMRDESVVQFGNGFAAPCSEI